MHGGEMAKGQGGSGVLHSSWGTLSLRVGRHVQRTDSRRWIPKQGRKFGVQINRRN